MGDVIKFPLVLRSGDEPAPTETAVVLFPFGRRRHLVERHARAMRAMSGHEAEEYLTRELEKLCDDLRAMGVDCPDCETVAIFELSDAIGKELHGPDFRLQIDGSF